MRSFRFVLVFTLATLMLPSAGMASAQTCDPVLCPPPPPCTDPNPTLCPPPPPTRAEVLQEDRDRIQQAELKLTQDLRQRPVNRQQVQQDQAAFRAAVRQLATDARTVH